MYNPDTDLLFPPRVIPTLGSLRGKEWRSLVESVALANDASAERLAFMLAMVRLCGCITCDSDSHRALAGCTLCARQSLQRFKGPDEELLQQVESARRDVLKHLNKNCPDLYTVLNNPGN